MLSCLLKAQKKEKKFENPKKVESFFPFNPFSNLFLHPSLFFFLVFFSIFYIFVVSKLVPVIIFKNPKNLSKNPENPQTFIGSLPWTFMFPAPIPFPKTSQNALDFVQIHPIFSQIFRAHLTFSHSIPCHFLSRFMWIFCGIFPPKCCCRTEHTDCFDDGFPSFRLDFRNVEKKWKVHNTNEMNKAQWKMAIAERWIESKYVRGEKWIMMMKGEVIRKRIHCWNIGNSWIKLSRRGSRSTKWHCTCNQISFENGRNWTKVLICWKIETPFSWDQLLVGKEKCGVNKVCLLKCSKDDVGGPFSTGPSLFCNFKMFPVKCATVTTVVLGDP